MGDSFEAAPGANDNGTGVASILELLPLLPEMQFERTLKVIFFSGEENFQEGSAGYIRQHLDDRIIGVINLDMYGTDKDGDRCFEMYVGTLEGSLGLANIISIAAFAVILERIAFFSRNKKPVGNTLP